MGQISLAELYPEMDWNKNKSAKTRERIKSGLSIDLIYKIREEVKNGKPKKQVAKELGISCYQVRKNTKYLPIQSKLPSGIVEKIRGEVENGKSKIEVAIDFGVSYDFVKGNTKDIASRNKKLSDELIGEIREEVKKRNDKCLVANEHGISKSTVWKYTRDLTSRRKTPPEVIEQIRGNVQKYGSKKKTAREMNISCSMVEKYTKDIHLQKRITDEMIEEMRNRVKKGELKAQVADDMNITCSTVSRYTLDIYQVRKSAKISANAFSLLREILKKGYSFSQSKYGLKEYQRLKKEFPKICRTKLYNIQIFYLEDQYDIAMRAFLEKLNTRIISYQKLQQVIKAFQGNMGKKEKRKYVDNHR